MENNLNSFEEDLLNRKPLAENLTNIIEESNDINVIAIDSEWGTGKTTFINMWQNMINTDKRYKDKFETLYFNAWENDYIKDPLLALITEINKQLKKDDGKVKKGLDYIEEHSKNLITPILATIIKILTNGILDLDKFKSGKFNEDQITKLMGDITQISVKELVEKKERRSKFINDLKDYMKKYSLNIIFFIDEIDRCRPSFAIELLEVIKHLFNIKNITFIISVDKEQLAYSISTLYGQGMDSDGYLRRFFDLEYKMPILNKEIYIDLKNKNIFYGYKNTKYLEIFIKELIIRDNFSFRDIDKTYEYIKLLLPMYVGIYSKTSDIQNENFNETYILVHGYILAQMIDIKIKHNDVYKKIINLNYNCSDVEINNMLKFNEINYIKLDQGNDNILKQIIKTVMNKYLKLFKLTDGFKELPKVKNFNKEYFTVSYKDATGRNFTNYESLRMWLLIDDENFNFVRKMEFLDDFNNL